MKDPEIFNLIEAEHQRQLRGIELIASENFVSNEVMQAMGSWLTNKYAEGYPGHRYYGGCAIVDQTESIAIERAKKLFEAEYVNVQPHSGAQANAAVFLTCLKSWRHFHGPKPRPRWSPFTWFKSQHLRHALQPDWLQP